MNFDWYGASVDVEASEALGEALGAFDSVEVREVRPRYGFGRAAALERAGGVVMEVLWENRGARDSNACFIQGTGRNAAPVATWLKAWKPCHRVARADVAEDYSGEGAWDRLSGMCLEVADKHHIEVEHAGDHHRAIKGRSFYLGGRTSVVREICYEKGKQIGGDPNHVRLELRVRPGSRDAKYRAAALQPAELYGASRWSAELALRLGNPEVSRMSLGTVYRADDIERARKALFRQYGATLRGIASEFGGWSEAGEWIHSQIGD